MAVSAGPKFEIDLDEICPRIIENSVCPGGKDDVGFQYLPAAKKKRQSASGRFPSVCDLVPAGSARLTVEVFPVCFRLARNFVLAVRAGGLEMVLRSGAWQNHPLFSAAIGALAAQRLGHTATASRATGGAEGIDSSSGLKRG
jgi:hypothetical protein